MLIGERCYRDLPRYGRDPNLALLAAPPALAWSAAAAERSPNCRSTNARLAYSAGRAVGSSVSSMARV